MAALWPDAEGATAKASFDTTLFRLRKLLDLDNALVLVAGKLSLARELCWTDVWSLESVQQAQQASERVDGSSPLCARSRRRAIRRRR